MRQSTKCFFGYHSYEPVSVNNMERIKYILGRELDNGNYTVILKKCIHCGKLTTQNIEGSWRLDDVKNLLKGVK